MYVGEKATVIVYNKFVDEITNKVVGYSCFNLKNYTCTKISKSSISNSNYFGRDLSNSKGFNLFYEDRLPIIDYNTMEFFESSRGIVVIGRLDFLFQNYKSLYLFTLGDSKFYLCTSDTLLSFRDKNIDKINIVNIDKSGDVVRCNQATLPTLNTYKVMKAYSENLLSINFENQKLFEFLLNLYLSSITKIHNHNDYKRISERHNSEVLRKKEEQLREDLNKDKKNLFNCYVSNKYAIKDLYSSDSTIKEVLETVNPNINLKSNIATVQCNVDMSKENIDNILSNYSNIIGICQDSSCEVILKDIKKYYSQIKEGEDNSKKFEGLRLNMYYSFNILFDSHDFSQPPCVSCYPTQELYGFYVFTTSNPLGFTSVRIPTKTFIKTNNGTDFNLGNLKTSYHEYIHYLSTDDNGNCGFILFEFLKKEEKKKDRNDENNEEEITNIEKPQEIKYARAYRKITEGITDMLAGYFLYINCKELYDSGKYLYNSKGGKLDLEEIKKTYSPFLRDITTLKPIENIELDMSKLFNSDEVYKKGVGSAYTYNMILVYCLGHLIGWNDLLSGYFLNAPEYLYELLVEKIGEYRADKFLELLNNENLGSSSVGVLSKQNFDKLRVYLGKGGEIELY